jgi:hypothetical protein
MLVQLNFQNAFFSIHADYITVTQQRDWATDLRLRANVSNTEATGTTAKTAIGNECHILAQILAV